MRSRRLSILACLLGGLLLPLATAPAAPQDGGGGRSGGLGNLPATIIDLSFPGGTAAEYVAALRKTSAPVNVVVLNDISPVRVPPMTLKRVEIAAAVSLLDGMPDVVDAPTIYLEVNQPAAAEGASTDVFTIQARARSMRRAARGEAQTMVVSVRDLLEEHVKVDDLLTAVETALEQLRSEYQPADVKFHEATGLLICRGQPGQTNAIEQVIAQLQDDMVRSLNRQRADRDLEGMAARLAELEQELAATREALQSAEQQSREYEMVIHKERMAVESMQVENQRLHARIDELERELKIRSDRAR
jgi:hypothetical protein